MTIWISHRGLCTLASENTAQSFRAAIDAGFRHLETDLRTTADGHIVLSHDASLARLGGPALIVEHATRAQLEKVRLGRGERLLFFDDFLEEFSGFHWILDIKRESAGATISGLSQWRRPPYVQFFDQRARFLLWRNHHQQLLWQSIPGAVCMARSDQCRRAGLACLAGLKAFSGITPDITYAVPPRFKSVNLMNRPIIDRYRSRGARILAFLPERETDIARALELGVEEILTDSAVGFNRFRN